MNRNPTFYTYDFIKVDGLLKVDESLKVDMLLKIDKEIQKHIIIIKIETLI